MRENSGCDHRSLVEYVYHNYMNIKALVSTLLLLSVASVCQSLSASDADQVSNGLPNFAGSWEVDYEHSESTEDKLAYLYEITRSHYKRQISRNDQTVGAIQTARRELQGLINLGRLAEIITRPQVLTIEQSREEILVKRQGNFALTCDLQGPEATNSALGKKVCTRHNDQLIFRLELPGGLAVTHRLAMSLDGQRLNVATTVSSENIMQRFSVNRVYMPFEPGEGMYECEFTLAKKKTCHLGNTD